jgi:NAD(P)-dependent dehydrogenase (short-subunit alcohol dehydrogenase family)
MTFMLVTGAGRGIGAAIAIEAASRGWDVALHYGQSADPAERTATVIRDMGRRAISVKADLNDPTSISGLFAEAESHLGTLGALVNNAATDCIGEFVETSLADIDRVIRVNVISLMLCSQEAVRRMSGKFNGRGGAIINISSISTRTGGVPRDAIYTATKGAVDALTLALSNEVAGDGIRVCAVRPAMIATEMLEAAVGLEAAVEHARRTYPMRRPGRPEEVAKLAVWLAGEDASFISGRTYDVAGGA